MARPAVARWVWRIGPGALFPGREFEELKRHERLYLTSEVCRATLGGSLTGEAGKGLEDGDWRSGIGDWGRGERKGKARILRVVIAA
jgi:hypothetical protein